MHAHISSIDALTTLLEIKRHIHADGRKQFDIEVGYRARRLLTHAARHVVGGYRNDSPEERAVDMLLRIAQEIPL